MDLPEPIVVVSDLHLKARGRWREAVERLSPLWRDAGSVVFNGDTIDWHWKVGAELQREIVGVIAERCARDGARALFLSGNADHKVSNRRHLSLHGGRTLITHGHALYPSISPWRPRPAVHVERTRRALLDLTPARRDTLEGRLEAAQTAMRRLFEELDEWHARHPVLGALPELPWYVSNPARLWIVLRTLARFPEDAAAFFERFAPSARVLILGHVHRAGVWRIGDRVVINTGHYCRGGRPLRVRIEAEDIRVERALLGKAGFTPGPVVEEFRLDATADHPACRAEPNG